MTVTFSEYERASIATVDCLIDRGIDAEGPILEANHTYSFITSGDVGEEEAVEAAVEQCEEEFSSAVDLGWADKIAPSEQEERAFTKLSWPV